MAYFMSMCVVIGVTTWIIVEKNYMSAIYGNVLMTVGAYLIVIGASIAFFVSLIGCFGAIARSKVFLFIYMCAMVVVFLFMIIGSILCIVYRTQIRTELQYTVMEKTLSRDYGVELDDAYNEYMTFAWDKAQRQLKCCAAADQGWLIYSSSSWHNEQPGLLEADKPYVPPSCCVRDQYGDYLDKQKCQTSVNGPPAQTSGDKNTALHYRGCYNAGRDFIIEFSGYLIGMGMGVGLSLIFGICLSFVLLRIFD